MLEIQLEPILVLAETIVTIDIHSKQIFRMFCVYVYYRKNDSVKSFFKKNNRSQKRKKMRTFIAFFGSNIKTITITILMDHQRAIKKEQIIKKTKMDYQYQNF